VVTDFSEYDLDKANNRVAALGSVDPGSYGTVGQGQDQNQYSETPFDLRGYDDAGNLVSIADPLAPGASTSVETRGLYYDYLDRLVRVDDSENAREHVYVYGALGRQIFKTVDVLLGGTRTDFVRFVDQF
jgi:hypothetical protein